MKKIYLQPEINVVTIHHEFPLLVDSNRTMDFYENSNNEDDYIVEEFEDLL